VGVDADDCELGEDALLAAARAQTGLSDFGGDDFRAGLRVLLETYPAAGFDARRLRRERRRILQLLATRLRVAEAFRLHPDVRARAIRAPLYLTGLPRTGTSALFNLLARDPAHRPLLLWEGAFPDPLEGLAPGQEDPRLVALRAHYARGRERNPGFTAIHEVRADGPEECVLLLAHAFRDVQLGVEVLLEPYGSWFQRQDLRPAYAYYLDLLRLLDWQRPGERWLLKSPAHLWALDLLVEALPDVAIVLTHRDPAESLGSYCSMLAALMTGRDFDPHELGPAVLEYLARSLERGLAARDRLDARRFLDLDYRRLLEDPLGAVEAIYAHFGLPLGAPARAAMAAHVRANPRHKHGVHAYDLERYGLAEGLVRERLAAYLERFDLPRG
jgi:hypothetical protein